MTEYKTANIKYDGNIKTIVCDQPNGSSPLVAVINYLSLDRNVCIEARWDQVISEEDLLKTIQDFLDPVGGWSSEDNQQSAVTPMLATQVELDPCLNWYANACS